MTFVYSEDYKKFLEQPSGNMDDTGYFSVQVIIKALALWNLELIPLHSVDEYAKEIQTDPQKAPAFVLHMENHWFCIRSFKINNDRGESVAFFNLNSLLSQPEYMSSLYLSEYLKQMENEGYSIFVVKGTLPECPADLSRPTLLPKQQQIKFVDLDKSPSTSSTNETDVELQRVIELSLHTSTNKKVDDNSDADLEKAMRLSLECFNDNTDT